MPAKQKQAPLQELTPEERDEPDGQEADWEDYDEPVPTASGVQLVENTIDEGKDEDYDLPVPAVVPLELHEYLDYDDPVQRYGSRPVSAILPASPTSAPPRPLSQHLAPPRLPAKLGAAVSERVVGGVRAGAGLAGSRSQGSLVQPGPALPPKLAPALPPKRSRTDLAGQQVRRI